MIPLKRMATTQEITNTVFFLTSEKSSFTTGSIIAVAGGEWEDRLMNWLIETV